jgi:hypothetical protein
VHRDDDCRRRTEFGETGWGVVWRSKRLVAYRRQMGQQLLHVRRTEVPGIPPQMEVHARATRVESPSFLSPQQIRRHCNGRRAFEPAHWSSVKEDIGRWSTVSLARLLMAMWLR